MSVLAGWPGKGIVVLKRLRVEVEAATAEQVVYELDRYEHAVKAVEAERFSLGVAKHWQLFPWHTSMDWRGFHDPELGRVLHEEVIEYDGSLPGYKGRRVVAFFRLDTRMSPLDDSGLTSVRSGGLVPQWRIYPEGAETREDLMLEYVAPEQLMSMGPSTWTTDANTSAVEEARRRSEHVADEEVVDEG